MGRNYFRFGMRIASAAGLAIIFAALSYYNLEWLLSKVNFFTDTTSLPEGIKMVVSGGLFLVSAPWFFKNLRFLESMVNEKLGVPVKEKTEETKKVE